MGFIVSLIVSLVIMVVGELLRPKQNPANAKPSSLDDFDFPTAEEGRSIPVIVGKVKINGANVTYYGDLEVQPLKKKVKTGLFSSKKQTYAYKYYIGMQTFLCRARPDFQIHDVLFGDKMPSHTRTDEANGVVRFDFNDENFYGGNEKEGGVTGTLRFYRGTETQEPSAYFSARIGETAPGYRGYAYAMLEKMYLGTSQYLKPLGYIVSSYPNTLGLTANKHKIGDDANPVCFVYEILNDGVWGLNLNPARIDVASFLTAAETVFNEGYGISMIINTGSSAEDLISEVLRHIDGVIFTDPSTGLITIKLARADYDIETIPEFGPDDLLEGIKFSRSSWSQTKNTVKVSYISRENNYQEAVVSQQDLANIMQREGEIASEVIDFRGFSHVDAANLACARALKTYSYPLAKVTCAFNRRAWTMRPGSVFKLNWPARGMDGVVMRVVRIDYGNLKQNRIDIDAVEDIFAISKSAYLPPPPSGWVDPIQPPTALSRQAITELPYGMAPYQSSAFVATLAARNTGIDEGYDIWSDRTGTYEFRSRNIDFTPTGLLVDAYAATTAAVDATGFKLSGLTDTNSIDRTATLDDVYSGNRIAVIVSSAGTEYVAYRYVNDNGDGTFQVATVVRGVFDTVPLSHPAGGRVWFLSEGFGLENEEAPYISNRTLNVRLLPFNVRGVLPFASAPTLSYSVTMRTNNPYPPANLKVNNVANPTTVTGNAALTWGIRHRVLQNTAVVAQDAASVTATPEGTYTIRVYIDGAVRRTVTLAAAPYDSFTYTTAMRTSDFADVTKRVSFGITAVNGSLVSMERMTSQMWMLSVLAAFSITNNSPLPNVTKDEPYNETLFGTGGVAPYTWDITAGTLPTGLSLNPATGVISGTWSGTVASSPSITFRATDQAGQQVTKALTLPLVLGCQDYTIPASPKGNTFNLSNTESALPNEDNTLSICEEITNPPPP